jgi:flagellar motor component MotA
MLAYYFLSATVDKILRRYFMFFLGLIGVFGVMMYAAVTGGNPGAFIDLPSLVVVVVASFFAALAMSKGKFDERTISLTGDAAVIIGWLGFLIGLVLMAGDLKNLLANDLIGPAFGVAFLTVLYGYFLKLVCFMYSNSK